MNDKARLALLYSSMPENSEQAERRIKLINDLELKLGLRDIDNSVLAENGELDDVNSFRLTKA